jgi:hypothetical protein
MGCDVARHLANISILNISNCSFDAAFSAVSETREVETISDEMGVILPTNPADIYLEKQYS